MLLSMIMMWRLAREVCTRQARDRVTEETRDDFGDDLATLANGDNVGEDVMKIALPNILSLAE